MIKGGVRENIIPDNVEMRGTIRTFDEGMRDDVHERVTDMAEAIARGVARRLHGLHPQELSGDGERPGAHRADGCRRCERVAGADEGAARAQGHRLGRLLVLPAAWCRGCSSSSASRRREPDPDKAAPNHSPRFFVDERGLLLGVRALAHVACDWLEAH